MPRWQRSAKSFLAKRRKISDGEIIRISVESAGYDIDAFDDRVYQSLVAIKSTSTKYLTASAIFLMVAILSHFGVLKSLRAGGVELSQSIFSHFALVSLSVISAAFCVSYSKQTYMMAWFTWRYKSGDSGSRAKLLLLYPEAFFHFFFLPVSIGYPKFFLSKKSAAPQVITLIVVLLSLVIFSVGCAIIWVLVAIDTLSSHEISKSVSIMTVAFSAGMILLGWTAPFYRNGQSEYEHHGMVQILTTQSPEKQAANHIRILRAAERMGLLDSSK